MIVKLCECGCGIPAPIAKVTSRKKGHVKGEPVRFVSGHNTRGKPKSAETRRKMSAYHLNRPAAHHEKLVAANRRPRSLRPDARSSTIHAWLGLHHPKAGVCEQCGAQGKTDYAFLRHGEAYTRDRSDYRELCRSCHVQMDYDSGVRSREVFRRNRVSIPGDTNPWPDDRLEEEAA